MASLEDQPKTAAQRPIQTHAFYRLPLETNQEILSHLSDKDLASAYLSSTKMSEAINADYGSFWRQRHCDEFETSDLDLVGSRAVDNALFRHQYQKRKHLLKYKLVHKLMFAKGETASEKQALKMVRGLVLDAFSDKTEANADEYDPKNINHLIMFVERVNLLRVVGMDSRSKENHRTARRDTRFLYAIQCVLAPALFTLGPSYSAVQFGFSDAQTMAYAHNEAAPILHGARGLEVNMTWLLRNIQFWRHHFLIDDGILRPAYEGLDEEDRPQWWDSKLSQNITTLGRHWRGSYAFVDRNEMNDIRAGRNTEEAIIDQLNGEEDPSAAFQSLDLNLADPNATWFPPFEKHLHSLTIPESKARSRAQHSGAAGSEQSSVDFAMRALRFNGGGHDNTENFLADGWLNPLPPQFGIPGWQRMTMMKFFIDNEGIDMDALWAYEGILLPGGKIMIGRWWCPSDGYGADMYSGPFILWNVENPMQFDDLAATEGGGE